MKIKNKKESQWVTCDEKELCLENDMKNFGTIIVL